MASEAILGPKTSLQIFAFALAWHQDCDSLQACIHGDKWPSAVSSLLWMVWRSGARKLVRILLNILEISLIVIQAKMCGYRAQICSFSHLPSSLLCPDYDVRVGIDLCRWYADFSPKSKGSEMLSQSKYWSSDCQACRTCSATPDRGSHHPVFNRLQYARTKGKVGRLVYFTMWMINVSVFWGRQMGKR